MLLRAHPLPRVMPTEGIFGPQRMMVMTPPNNTTFSLSFNSLDYGMYFKGSLAHVVDPALFDARIWNQYYRCLFLCIGIATGQAPYLVMLNIQRAAQAALSLDDLDTRLEQTGALREDILSLCGYATFPSLLGLLALHHLGQEPDALKHVQLYVLVMPQHLEPAIVLAVPPLPSLQAPQPAINPRTLTAHLLLHNGHYTVVNFVHIQQAKNDVADWNSLPAIARHFEGCRMQQNLNSYLDPPINDPLPPPPATLALFLRQQPLPPQLRPIRSLGGLIIPITTGHPGQDRVVLNTDLDPHCYGSDLAITLSHLPSALQAAAQARITALLGPAVGRPASRSASPRPAGHSASFAIHVGIGAGGGLLAHPLDIHEQLRGCCPTPAQLPLRFHCSALAARALWLSTSLQTRASTSLRWSARPEPPSHCHRCMQAKEMSYRASQQLRGRHC